MRWTDGFIKKFLVQNTPTAQLILLEQAQAADMSLSPENRRNHRQGFQTGIDGVEAAELGRSPFVAESSCASSTRRNLRSIIWAAVALIVLGAVVGVIIIAANDSTDSEPGAGMA